MPNIELRASDGHEFDAHRVDPLGPVRGGVVVVQEIFGVNRHMRAVAARFAAAGWSAIVPAFFDRIEPGVELGYEPADFTRGRELVGKLQIPEVMLDLQAAIDALHLKPTGTAKGGECPKPEGTAKGGECPKPEGTAKGGECPKQVGRVGIVGYCWGGAIVWLGAARLHGLDAAISYYGSRIVNYVDEAPRVPTMLHVGRADASLPIEKVRELGRRYGDLAIHEYEAGHGFDCDHRADFESTASAHAMTRTLAWLEGPPADD